MAPAALATWKAESGMDSQSPGVQDQPKQHEAPMSTTTTKTNKRKGNT